MNKRDILRFVNSIVYIIDSKYMHIVDKDDNKDTEAMNALLSLTNQLDFFQTNLYSCEGLEEVFEVTLREICLYYQDSGQHMLTPSKESVFNYDFQMGLIEMITRLYLDHCSGQSISDGKTADPEDILQIIDIITVNINPNLLIHKLISKRTDSDFNSVCRDIANPANLTNYIFQMLRISKVLVCCMYFGDHHFHQIIDKRVLYRINK